MNRKRTLIALAIAIVLIVVIVIVLIAKGKKGKAKEKSESSDDDKKRKMVGAWKKMTNLPNLNLADLQLPDDPFSFKLILDPALEAQKKRIFPLLIRDIELTDTMSQDPDYQPIISALKNYPRAPTKEEILFLLKYRKFMDRDDVYSMCGPREIEQMYVILLNVAANKVQGDIVETGVWKGGMSMWMKAVLKHFGDTGRDDHHNERRLWMFDVFDTFPEPTAYTLTSGDVIETHPNDQTIHSLTKVMYSKPASAVKVRDNFQALNLLDDKVSLVVGLFSQTIPIALRSGLQSIAVLRIDNDYYDSVLYVLETLYPFVNEGGYVVIDDYNNPVLGCKDAVHQFRTKYGIASTIVDTYGGSIYWQVV